MRPVRLCSICRTALKMAGKTGSTGIAAITYTFTGAARRGETIAISAAANCYRLRTDTCGKMLQFRCLQCYHLEEETKDHASVQLRA